MWSMLPKCRSGVVSCRLRPGAADQRGPEWAADSIEKLLGAFPGIVQQLGEESIAAGPDGSGPVKVVIRAERG